MTTKEKTITMRKSGWKCENCEGRKATMECFDCEAKLCDGVCSLSDHCCCDCHHEMRKLR